MSEFEIVSLFNELLNTCMSRLNDFILGLFAMLVTAYLAARELTRLMAGLVVTLYTVFSIVTITPTVASCNRFALFSDVVREAASVPGSLLPGIFASTLPSPQLVTPTMALLLVLAYLGGLVFFFQARRRGRDD